MDELANVKGRGWEDIDVREPGPLLFARLERTLTYSAALIMHVSDMAKGHMRMQVRYDWPTCLVDAGGNPFGRARAVRCAWTSKSPR
jgi:hypothetical protein